MVTELLRIDRPPEAHEPKTFTSIRKTGWLTWMERQKLATVHTHRREKIRQDRQAILYKRMKHISGKYAHHHGTFTSPCALAP